MSKTKDVKVRVPQTVSIDGNKYVIQDAANLRLVFRDNEGNKTAVTVEDFANDGWPEDDDGTSMDFVGYVNVV